MSQNERKYEKCGLAPRGAWRMAVAMLMLHGCGTDSTSADSGEGVFPGTNGAATTTTGTSSETTTGTTVATTSTSATTTGTAATTTGTAATTTGSAATTTGNAATTTGNAATTTGAAEDGGATVDAGMTQQDASTAGSGEYYADPVIPAMDGQCPDFKTGSFSFGGLRGDMQAGPQGSGTGALLFYWHGTGSSPSELRGMLGSNAARITDEGGIIVAVQGGSGGDSSCSGTGWFDGDFGVIDQIVACAVQNHGINPRRIYATGCSAGGLQSGCMALRRTDYVAAVAPNSGGKTLLGDRSFSNAASMNVPPSMTMHGGSSDNVLGQDFSQSSAQYNATVTGAGGFAVNCNHGGGHCRAPADLYTAAIDFLLAHPFGTRPSPYESGLPATFPDYCEIQ